MLKEKHEDVKNYKYYVLGNKVDIEYPKWFEVDIDEG